METSASTSTERPSWAQERHSSLRDLSGFAGQRAHLHRNVTQAPEGGSSVIPSTFLTSHLKGQKETRSRGSQFAAHVDLWEENNYVAR